jgi:Raf kinase inhibitor-like YbhB/YbcL family protein
MKKITFAVVAALGLLGAGVANAKMTLSSPDVKNGGSIAMEQVANIFGCKGGNLSPALTWKGAPKDTKSFALTVYDPDAPTGSGFWHWVVFNIPVGTTSLPKNAGDPKANLMPAGAVQSRTDYGIQGYGGPCPPPGAPHRYKFTIFAVDVDKFDDMDANVSAAVVGFHLNFHTKAKAQLIATYGQPK